MTIEARLDRWERRQEAMISAIGDLATITGSTHTLVVELMAWLKAPPSDAIPDLIEELTGALQALTGAVEAQGQQIAALPAAVARAVGTDEV